jgi:tRNA threonylcarbamoyladenosine biosynthesis protein TsaB
MGEVYSAHYRFVDGLPVLEGAEHLVPPTGVVAPDAAYLAVGDGFAAYADALAAATVGAVATQPALAPRAQDLLPQARREVLAGRFVPLESALPVYLRQADAWRRS